MCNFNLAKLSIPGDGSYAEYAVEIHEYDRHYRKFLMEDYLDTKKVLKIHRLTGRCDELDCIIRVSDPSESELMDCINQLYLIIESHFKLNHEEVLILENLLDYPDKRVKVTLFSIVHPIQLNDQYLLQYAGMEDILECRSHVESYKNNPNNIRRARENMLSMAPGFWRSCRKVKSIEVL